MCCMVRGNRLRDDCLLYLYSAGDGSVSDAVLDENYSSDCRCGIYVEGNPERMLLSENTCERVEEDIHYQNSEGVVQSQIW